MAAYDRNRSAPQTGTIAVYLAVLALAFIVIAGGAAMWLATDNSGTNVLATDPSSTSPPSPVAAP